MRKKSITLILITFFLIFSVGLKISDSLSIQSYIETDVNNVLTTATFWSNATVISDICGWNNGMSQSPSIAVDGSGNVHVVWHDGTDGEWGSDFEIMYANYTTAGWSNATVISDDATGWNDDGSYYPSIAIDGDGYVHVVWEDWTYGEWGGGAIDMEIMYTNYTAGSWSNATVISDIYGWNNGTSEHPSIAIDGDGNVHVVWDDWTSGEWGIDQEIMYANYTSVGWSNATVISDLYGWNDDISEYPSIAIDSDGNVHVVWEDGTNGEWGGDSEIMYTNYTAGSWSNATVISDTYGWNNDMSATPSIAIDGDGNVHVVWEDSTSGAWGTDWEIMYTRHTANWSNPMVLSDDLTGWNNGGSYESDIAIDSDGNVHVVWMDSTNGEWGTDYEIMYANYTLVGWSNATVISDVYGWNNGMSVFPSIAIDSNGNMHVVWEDYTDSEWGTDVEIMYTRSAPQTGNGGEQIKLIIVPSPDSSISIFSPLELGIIGIAVAIAVIITAVIMKKIK